MSWFSDPAIRQQLRELVVVVLLLVAFWAAVFVYRYATTGRLS